MDAPSVLQIRERSALLDAAYTDDADGNAALELLIATVAPLVGSLTGRIIAGTEGEEVPDSMLELARLTIALKADQLHGVVGDAEDRVEALERSNLRSIAAGSWSESYWGPGEAAKGHALDTDPVLAELLWALATEDKKAEWLETWDPNHQRPASAIEAFDYSSRPGGY